MKIQFSTFYIYLQSLVNNTMTNAYYDTALILFKTLRLIFFPGNSVDSQHAVPLW